MDIKRFISIFLAIILSLGVCSVAVAEGNSEIPEGYTPVYTAEDLNNIRNNLSGKYILMNDIDLSVYENWEPIGTTKAPFAGELNGNGFAVKKLLITSGSQYNIGLFGVTQKADINNLALINSNISLDFDDRNAFSVGLIIGRMGEKSQLKNCTASGFINIGESININVGGLVGYAGNAVVSNCSNYSCIEIDSCGDAQKIYAGGLIGYKSGMLKQVYECSNFGDIKFKAQNASLYALGGICGLSYAYIYNSYNRGIISTEVNDIEQAYVGGIAGISTVIAWCYNSGQINISENFNGFAGALTGNAESSQFGTPGSSDFSRMQDSYYSNKNVFAGYKDENTFEDYEGDYQHYSFLNVKKLTDEEMLIQKSFAEFDFEIIWTMEENGFPVLQNQPVINVKEEISLEIGEKADIDLTDCEWSIEDDTIVTVNENGEVVGLSAGETVITVEMEYGYIYEYTIAVAEPVAEPPIDNPDEPTEDFWLVGFFKWIWNIIISVVIFVYNTVKSVVFRFSPPYFI